MPALGKYRLNRGSYMSAHVLLNLLNELGKITLKSHFCRKKRYNFVIMYATLLWTSYNAS